MIAAVTYTLNTLQMTRTQESKTEQLTVVTPIFKNIKILKYSKKYVKLEKVHHSI